MKMLNRRTLRSGRPMRHRHPANVALHEDRRTIGRSVDSFVAYFGSLSYLALQTAVIIAWIVLNLAAWAHHWDVYPFILLNLVFSTQAAYAAPLILMAQNRSAEHDRLRAEEDYRVNNETLADLRQLRAEHAELQKLLNQYLVELRTQAGSR